MKTAVEWLEEMLNNPEFPDSSMLFKQAKEMEKEQIMAAYLKNHLQGCWMDKTENEYAEEYYNETFKSETIVTEYRDGTINVEHFKSEE